MKRTFLLTALILLFCGSAKAAVVPYSKAKTVAECFLHVDNTRASGGLTLLWDGSDAKTRAGEEPLFYIFNRDGGGWVIVSGDDAIEPVIAYSYQGKYVVDGMPENLQDYFRLLKEDIRYVRASGRKGNAAEWAQAMVRTRANDTIPSAVLLKTANFNQGAPWNLKCPLIDGKHALAGCCAIALSIIMEYHKYPEHGTGTVGGYSTSTYTAPSVELGHKYQWDKIKKSYKSGTYTDEEADAVSTLVRDVALMGRSSFGLSGTGSTMSGMCNKARDYFYYNKGAHRITHSQYTDAEWFKMLKRDLDEGLPINYASDTHSYVCDGYDARNYVHFNYGWGGSDNGYYNIAGKTAYGCCVRLKPEVGKSETSYFIELLSKDSYKGISKADTKQIVKGTEFKMKVGSVYNLGFDSFAFEWVLAHTDKDGKIKEIISTTRKNTLAYQGYTNYSSIPCTINEDIVLGDMIKAFYRPAKSEDEWTPMTFAVTTEGFVGNFPLTGEAIGLQSSLEYDKGNQRFVITTDKNATFRLLDANGNEAPSGSIEGRYGTIYVHTDVLSAGEYVIELSAKYYIDVKRLKIRVK